MLTIYQKELKSYLTSMIGFVFAGFFLAIIGIYTVALNLVSGYSNFEYVLQSISFIFIILIPILTMKVMAEEKKQKTEQLLYTAPVSVEKIILGKYFALLTLFLGAAAVTLLYPLILRQFGTVNFGMAYGAVLGFSLMGAAYIAIGVFISSLTESQMIAAVVSFLCFLLTNLMPGIAGLLPTDNITCLLVLAIGVVLTAWSLYFMTRSFKLPVIFAAASAGAITGIYFIKPEWFTGLLGKICNSAAVMSRFDNFTMGILDIPAVFYFISIAALFLFLTIIFIKSSFTPRRLKSGAYHSALIAVVTGIVIMVNLFASELNLKIDVSADGMYTLTNETKNLVKNISGRITVYYIVQDGNQTSQIENIIRQYDGLSGKVTVVEKDPVKNPGFALDFTSEEVEEESIIVVNEETGISKYIPYGDMLVTQLDYNTYQSMVTAVDVEGQLSSAIQYVTAADLPKIYVTTGHGEAVLSDSVKKAIKKLNVDLEDLPTLTAGEIPEDCDILLVNAPYTDFTEEETVYIKTYLENGGNAILNTAYTTEAMDNYNSLLGYYGITPNAGIVVEEAGNYMGNNPTYLIPSVMSHSITGSVDKYVVMAAGQGLTISGDLRSTVTAEPLLATSDGAYSKTNMESESIEKEEGDIDGPFSLGVAVTESFEDTRTKLAVYSSAYLMDEAFTSTGQFGNSDLLINTINWMNEFDAGLSIPERSVSQTYLSVTPSQVVFWGVVLVFILPLSLLGAGLIIWLRRRKN